MSLTKSWTNQIALAQSSGAGEAGTVTMDQICAFTGNFTAGFVWIEASFDSGTTWIEVPESKHNKPTIFQLFCPDTSVQYRFGCIGIVGTVNCYMGP